MSLKGKTVANPADQRWIDLVAKHGHAVMCVADAVDELTDQPPFAYSTGAYESYGAPELIVFGLDGDAATRIINDFMSHYQAGRHYRCGVFETGLVANDVPVVFLEATGLAAKSYAAFTDWYYERRSFPLWQLFWRAEDGCFPWDADYPSDPIWHQPDLTRGGFAGHPQ